MSETCSNCRFSAPSLQPDKWSGPECRRRPPVTEIRPSWPRTYDDGWCGEYEAAKAVPAPKKRPAAGEVETRNEQG